MGSVGPGDLNKLMKSGESPLALVPGGFQEATLSCCGHERVFLKTRKGFVKYALRHGYALLPRRGVPLTVAVGPPVKIPQIDKPTKKDVDHYHERYVAALQELYHKVAAGTASEKRPLEVM